MKRYLKSAFSIKKFTHKRVSWLCLWENSIFTKQSHILLGARLLNVKLGKYSRVGVNTKVANTTIGNFTAIGRNCNIGPGQHPTNLISTNSIFYRKGQFQDGWAKELNFEASPPITIGNDIWIGINSIIMDGVTIGDGALVAAGSVVTKDIPPYAIVGGVPAKVIKYRFDEAIRNKLLEIKWWNLPENVIEDALPIFTDTEITIEKLEKYFQKMMQNNVQG